MEDDGESPDQDVTGRGFLEGAADPADVVDRRRTDLRDVWLLIQPWASSKVEKRYRPRGASPAPPRRARNVCWRVCTASRVDAPSRRRPTTLDGSRSISRSRSTGIGYALHLPRARRLATNPLLISAGEGQYAALFRYGAVVLFAPSRR